MADASVQTLIGNVRRRLWHAQFVAALRMALWGTAGLMLLAVAVHLALRPVTIGLLLWAQAALWLALLARAAWLRPTQAACALWADRHLGGASAYSTLLDTAQGNRDEAQAQALRWLESWAEARVPGSLRALAAGRPPTRLSRSLLAAGVCSAMAALVLMLPDVTRVETPPDATPAPRSVADTHTPEPASASANAELTSEIAAVLRSAAMRDSADRREDGKVPAAAGRGKADDGPAPQAARTGATFPGEQARASAATSGAGAGSHSAGAVAAGNAPGRQAGEARDAGDAGDVSPRVQATIDVPGSARRAVRPAGAGQADMEQVAVYEDTLTTEGAAPAGPAPAPAAAPSATGSVRLSASETSYVQAWLKTRPRR